MSDPKTGIPLEAVQAQMISPAHWKAILASLHGDSNHRWLKSRRALTAIAHKYMSYKEPLPVGDTRPASCKALKLLAEDILQLAGQLAALPSDAEWELHQKLAMRSGPEFTNASPLERAKGDLLDLRSAVSRAHTKMVRSPRKVRQSELHWAVQKLADLFEKVPGNTLTHTRVEAGVRASTNTEQKGSPGSAFGKFCSAFLNAVDPSIQPQRISTVVRACLERRHKSS